MSRAACWAVDELHSRAVNDGLQNFSAQVKLKAVPLANAPPPPSPPGKVGKSALNLQGQGCELPCVHPCR